MKKAFFSIFSVAAVMIAALTINSCTKQESNEQALNPANEQYQMTAEDKAVLNSILQFKDKITYIKEHPGFKNGELLEADSAVWLLEALFNATYGFSDEHYTKTKIDTTTFSIEVDENGYISLDDIYAKYNDIVNIVTVFHNNSGFENKGYILLDLKSVETDNGQMEIQLRSVTGDKNGNWEPFGEDDDWYYGYHEGDCEMIGTEDAADKIQLALMDTRPIYYPPPGYRYIYTDEEDVPLFGYEYSDESGELFIFLIEHENGIFENYETCLEQDEMNYYYNQEKTLIYDFLPAEMNKPNNWTFRECTLLGLNESHPNTGNPTIHHNNSLTYALRWLVPIGTIDPPIDL